MIKVEKLRKVYRTDEIETTALNEVDLVVEPGEFVSVMGPSGCGKSTLLNVLGLLDTASGGRYDFMGKDIAGLSDRERTELRKRNIGFVFQSFNLIDELTVFENVELPLVYLGEDASERTKAVDEVLARTQLTVRRNHYPQQLSGGQQQRVAVARAIVTRPRLILADEPTGNLDSSHGEDVMGFLAGLNGDGTTVLMVTHSPQYAGYARRTLQLFDGQIVTDEMNGGFHV